MGKDMEKQAITLTLAPALHFSAMIEDKMQQAAKKTSKKTKNNLQLSGLFMCRHRCCRKWFDLQISLLPSLSNPHPPHYTTTTTSRTLQVVGSWIKQMTDL